MLSWRSIGNEKGQTSNKVGHNLWQWWNCTWNKIPTYPDFFYFLYNHCLLSSILQIKLKRKKTAERNMEASQEKVQSDHKAFGWAATDSSGLLSPFHFARRYICMYPFVSLSFWMKICLVIMVFINLHIDVSRSNGDDDITMRILYCGICHTDLGMLRNHHGISLYPLVPGYMSLAPFLY